MVQQVATASGFAPTSTASMNRVFVFEHSVYSFLYELRGFLACTSGELLQTGFSVGRKRTSIELPNCTIALPSRLALITNHCLRANRDGVPLCPWCMILGETVQKLSFCSLRDCLVRSLLIAQTVDFDGRPALILRNDKIELTILTRGATLANLVLRDDAEKLSPTGIRIAR